MKRIIYGFLLCSLAVMGVSCGSDNTDEVIIGYTTDKTLAIVKINLERLDGKLPKEEMMKDKSNNFSASEKEKMQLFMNAKDNGIDIEKPVYILTEQEKNDIAFSFFAWVNDEAKFEKSFSKITDTKVRIDKAKNLIYSDDKLIGGIKDDMVVLSRSVENPMTRMTRSYGYDEPEKDGIMAEKYYTDFWNRKPSEKEGIADQIEKSLGAEADMCTWINLYGVINTATKGYIETLAVNKMLLDAGIGLNLNFDNGKIELKTNTFFNEELQKLVKKHYDSKGIDYDIVKNIELDDAKGYTIGFVSLDFIKYFIKEAGFEAVVNSALSYKDLTLDDITNALDGSYAFASYKEEIVDEEDPYSYPKPSMVVALGINGSKAKKILDLVDNDPMFGFYTKSYHNNDVLVFATDENKLTAIRANKAAVNKNLKKESGIMSYSWATGEDINAAFAGKSKVKMTKMVSTSKMEGGNASSETVITLDKDKKNALHYLMGYE